VWYNDFNIRQAYTDALAAGPLPGKYEAEMSAWDQEAMSRGRAYSVADVLAARERLRWQRLENSLGLPTPKRKRRPGDEGDSVIKYTETMK
jgi:hypothetical protein